MLVVVVLLMMIALPTIQNVTGMNARKEVSKLAANLRAARGHAAVAGETCRLVINISGKDLTGKAIGSAYGLECTKGNATITKETSHDGRRDAAEKFDSMNDETIEQKKTREALEQRLAFQPSKVLPQQTLGGRMKIVSVWTPHQPEAYTQGQAYVYFFPTGTTEPANIVLQDGDAEDFYTVQMTGLAGEVHVVGEKAKLPQQDQSDSDSF